MTDFPKEPTPEADLPVTIRTYLNPFEAEWARSILADAGICSSMPDGAGAYLYNFVSGIRLQVPKSRVEEAEAVLHDREFEQKLRAGEPDRERGDMASGLDQEELEANAIDAIDADDVCPLPPPLSCPKCGSTDLEAVPTPAHELESFLGGLVNRLLGRSWRCCTACGHVFNPREKEVPPGV